MEKIKEYLLGVLFYIEMLIGIISILAITALVIILILGIPACIFIWICEHLSKLF